MHSKPLAGALLVFALALAGCSTQIETQQTEPFRIQLEGDGRTIQLDEDDSEQVQFETCGQEVDTCDVEEVEVAVQVKQASETPCKVKVTIQEKGGAVLETRIIDVGSGSGSANGTGNGTSNSTATGSTGGSGQVIVQNIVVNVKGKDNIVVITEAQQGSAEVNIAAHATGHSSNTVNDDDGTVTATASATATSSSTNTTSASNTTTG